MQSNRVILIIALVAGLVAMAAAFGYLRTASGALAKEPVEPRVDIVIAKADLPSDHLLDPAEDLTLQKVPARTFAQLVRSSVKSDERAALRGRRINTPIAAGMPVLYSHLVGVTDLEIAAGSRAFTINVDESDVIGGALIPGDRVDIVVSWKIPEAKRAGTEYSGGSQSIGAAVGQAIAGAIESRDWGARVALSNVKVLAVGDSLIRSREQFTFGDPNAKTARRQNARTVTLELTTEESLELIRSLGGGQNKLHMLLRPKQTSGGGAGSGLD